jgi:cytochrome P450
MTTSTPPRSCPSARREGVRRLWARAAPDDVPVYSADLYSVAAIRDPYPHYAAMRALGPVVWLPKHNLYALPRYAEVRSALGDNDTFRSNHGVALNPISRVIGNQSLLMTDGAAHDRHRKLMAHRLKPRALRPLQDRVEELAEQTVLVALAKGRVDGVAEMALKLPLGVVPDLVGWPQQGREHLVAWAGATFDMLGPLNKVALRSMPKTAAMLSFVHRLARRRDVLPGSMSEEVLHSIDKGDIKRSRLPSVFIDYLAPSIDTTASAIAAALWLFAQNPDQWRALQADPGRIPNAVNEIVRMESPVRAFGRLAQRDAEIAGARIPSGSRLLIVFASANRDERVWTDPDRFDVGREASGQVGFGYGMHACAGQGLARLETQAFLRSLLRNVDRIELDGTPRRAVNNVIHRFERLPLRLVAKDPVARASAPTPVGHR